MTGHLIPLGGGDLIVLYGTELTVGRDESCDIVLRARGVSSQHCRLVLKGSDWHVEDLGSRNGIRIDGRRCESGCLEPNSVLWIGGQRFEFESEAAPSSTTATEDDLAMSMLDASWDATNNGATASVARNDNGHQPVPTRESSRRRTGRSPDKGKKKPKRYLGKLTPAGGGELIPLLCEELFVGRHPRNDIVLKFPSVSAQHCRFDFRDGYWYVQDLGSSNGIRVNGERVSDSILLPGDTLRIAKLQFEISYKPESDEPPPVEDPFARSLLEKAGLEHKLRRDPDGAWLKSDQDHEPSRRVDLDTI